MTANHPAEVAAHYATEQHLRTRIETHRRYTVGPDLEASLDELLRLNGQEALLDVGTGPGEFPGRLRAQGHRGRLVGVDLSAGMVEQASAHQPGVEFVQASADALPFADATFDVVTARHMLYHVPNVAAVLTEFRRVLKPGGRFLAVTNASTYLSELWAAVAEAALSEPSLEAVRASRGSFAAAFSELNGEALVQDTFGHIGVSFSHSALVFPDAQPVLDYLASLPSWHNLSGPEQERGRAALGQVLRPLLQDSGWRVSKTLVFLRASK
ncbi:class I SAM-dependent methyltransferase [Deinococcus sp. QL22]|uniref:class I SAM-dependent methyltransferase n=1 Tax=Deinococcus sp. QL22 TaxID=2939437 RepID=UPI00201705B0|nr:class I SAM-dependent methyltransferase [Deinococcus sp. QL22]UQN05810.1 methyltransferase domain-containing protein [Deinococcus sp. QL22]